ncbi:hypothetical protein DXG03_001205 [Asterophora parasitica]|uniref:Uncharacterized protein n=1 Tax=Asterophora parasitica TaxID=117018 RepID=A0A9P7KD00_9AGAR|nr:hypothetical protein DXG03_001205 [Asterophora parasitica]
MLSSRPVALGIDSHVFPTKTPGRIKGRVENAAPMTIHGKGKEMAARTPFHGQKLLKDSAAPQTQGKQIILTTRPNARPLGDKTPFPNRARTERFETPLPKLAKFSVLSLLESVSQSNNTPDSQLRPSSARKHVRAPKSGGKSFETPLNNGNHWDVSELDIVIPEAEVQEALPEDDYDEVEYMAPNTLDLAYQPPLNFELPDYKEVGKALFKHAYSYHYDDTPVVEIEIKEDDIQKPGWDTLPLNELESDDPFHQAKAQISSAAAPPPAALRTTRLGGVNATRSASGASKAVQSNRPVATTRVPSSKSAQNVPSRPGTSASIVPSTRSTTLRTNATRSAVPSAAARPSAIPKRTAKPSVNSTSTIPSRPATSAATRSRAASTAATTPSVRRPATSTSSYKTTSQPRTASSKAAPAIRGRTGAQITKGTTTHPSGLVLLVDEGLALDDDFRFEV